MARAASSAKLRAAFATHQEETHTHVARVEQVFASLDEKVRGKHCDGMSGIIEDGKSIIEGDFDDATMDACLIAAAQRVEHYEIATYATLVVWANAMGFDEAASLLEQTLEEDKETDEKLASLGDGGITQDAADAAHRDDDDGEESDSRARGAEKDKAAAAAAKKGKRRRRSR